MRISLLVQIAKDEDYLQRHLLAGLPPLGERVQEIRQGKGKAATSAQNNDLIAEQSMVRQPNRLSVCVLHQGLPHQQEFSRGLGGVPRAEVSVPLEQDQDA